MNNIEYINKKRIDLINSDEYITGRKVVLIKQKIKKMQIIKLIKHIIRHLKIKKLSIKKIDNYEPIIMNNTDYKKKKIVVYSCITGNYDNIYEPLFESNNIDYILFTDNKKLKSNCWSIRSINDIKETKNLTPAEKNRYIKLNPFVLFKNEYDYAIYIDGNIQVISDIRKLINCIDEKYGISMHLHRSRNDIYKEYKVCKLLKKGNKENLNKQIKTYKENNFPVEYGMLECNIFAIDLKNNTAKIIFDNWYNEFNKFKSGRDQISLPYILWKNNIKIENVATMGSNVYINPLFYINMHKSGD